MRSEHFRLRPPLRNIHVSLIGGITTPGPDVARLSTPRHIDAAIRVKHLPVSQRHFCAGRETADVQRGKSWFQHETDSKFIIIGLSVQPKRHRGLTVVRRL